MTMDERRVARRGATLCRSEVEHQAGHSNRLFARRGGGTRQSAWLGIQRGAGLVQG